MAKKKYYAVKVGLIPGIYKTWEECKHNVEQYPKAQYKSFSSFEDAEAYMNGNENVVFKEISIESKKVVTNKELHLPPIFAFVDGSYNEKTGFYGYGGYISINNQKYILQGQNNDDLASMHNVAGEILGSKAAMQYAIEHNLKDLCILYDYLGVEYWAKGMWKRNKKGTIAYYDYYQSIKDKINIDFVHVKGHSNIEGNEEADKLAKQAVGIPIK